MKRKRFYVQRASEDFGSFYVIYDREEDKQTADLGVEKIPFVVGIDLRKDARIMCAALNREYEAKR